MRTKLYTLTGLLACFTWAAHSQNTIGTTTFLPELVDDGYTLIYPHNQPNVYLLDMCGEVVHTWTNADTLRPGNMVYLQENGDIVLTYRPQIFANDAIWAGGGGETIERRTWDNEVLWSYSLNDSTGRFHHDIEVKPDGNVFAIAWEHVSPEVCIEAGRDTALIPEEGLWSEMILELQPNDTGSADVVWEWHAWDHLVQDHDSTKGNYGVVSDHVRKIDVNYGSISSQPSDWLHINAIDYNPYFDHLMLSVPTFNELWVVDYDNFDAGEIIWRWGNPAAYDMGTEDDQKLFYQHDCHWVYDHVTINNPDFGKIAVFNNRVPSEDGGNHSAVHLLNPTYTDYDNNYDTTNVGTYLPESFDWSYVAPDSIYSSGLSSFQRLENGNSLICYGRYGDTREITPDGELAWRYRTPLVNAGGVASPVSQGTDPTVNQNMTFRAQRLPSDFPAFACVDLTQQGVIELDPTPLASCSVVGCTDPLACNYDPLATVPGDSCAYNSPSFEPTSDFVLGELLPEIGCNGGYAVTTSLPIVLSESDNGMSWTFDPEVEQILVENGFGFLVDDLTSQTLSLCDNVMNVLDASCNTYTLDYDSVGYINSFYNGYLAPANNFDEGCNFEFACNYDPCALPNFLLCEFLDVTVSTTDDNGNGEGTAVATAAGGEAPYAFAWFAGEDSLAFSFEDEVDSLIAGNYTVLAVDSTGCIGTEEFIIDFVSATSEVLPEMLVYPNPASSTVRLRLETGATGWVRLFEASGREVLAQPVQSTTTLIDVSMFPSGSYVLQFEHSEGLRTQQIQIVR